MFCLNKQEVKEKVRRLRDKMKSNVDVQKFIEQSSKYFMANLAPGFVGFCFDRDNFVSLHKIMFNFLREVDTIGFFCFRSLKLQEMLLSRMRKGY